MKNLSVWMTCVAMVALCGCGKVGGTKAETALNGAKAYAQAAVDIERMRKMESVDWKAIGEKVAITMPLVHSVDVAHGTTYEKAISAALQACAKGEKTHVNQQIISKGLQHVAVLAIRDELKKMPLPDTRQAAALMTEALFEAVRPTFARRDENHFAEEPQLEKDATEAILYVKTAEGGAFLSGIRKLEDVIDRTYALCVLFELEGIVEKRGTDQTICEKKQMEARVYYRIVAPRIKRTGSAFHELLDTMIEGSFDKVDVRAAEAALLSGLNVAKIR